MARDPRPAPPQEQEQDEAAPAGVPMVSTGSHVYEGRALKNGDEFEARDDRDADDLAALRFAVRKRRRGLGSALDAGRYLTRRLTAGKR